MVATDPGISRRRLSRSGAAAYHTLLTTPACGRRRSQGSPPRSLNFLPIGMIEQPGNGCAHPAIAPRSPQPAGIDADDDGLTDRVTRGVEHPRRDIAGVGTLCSPLCMRLAMSKQPRLMRVATTDRHTDLWDIADRDQCPRC